MQQSTFVAPVCLRRWVYECEEYDKYRGIERIVFFFFLFKRNLDGWKMQEIIHHNSAFHFIFDALTEAATRFLINYKVYGPL